MGTSLFKDVKDLGDGKHFIDDKRIADVLTLPPDRFGPVKFNAFEQILHSYLDVLPVVAKRIDTIEEHLEKGLAEGKAFIRPQERPDVGGAVVQDLSESVRQLNERLDRVESRLQG